MKKIYSLALTSLITIGTSISLSQPLSADSTISNNNDNNNQKESSVSSTANKDIVKHILVAGNKNISKEDILKLITNTKINEAYSKDNVKKDLEEISKSGIVQNVKGRTVQNNGELYVVFDVTELSDVKTVHIAGNTLIDSKDIISNLITKPKEAFNKKNIDTDIDKIKELYKNKGYIAIVSDVNNNNGDVTFTISEAKIENIIYSGNVKTKDWVMDKIVYQRMHKGDFLKVKSLQNMYSDLIQTGFFKDVKVDANDGSTKGNVILKITVIDDKTGEWNLGGGYSDQYKAEVVGGIRNKNINGEAKSINFDVGIGSGKQSFNLSYTDPYWKKSDTAVTVNVFKNQKDVSLTDAKYTEHHTGGSIGFSKPISKDKKTKFFSNFTVDNITTDYTSGKKIDGVKDNTITMGVVRNDVNEETGNGTVTEASITTSQKFLGSDNDFTKFMVGIKNYAKLSVKDTLASRLQFNYSPNELPTVEQFSIGGQNSVRGLDEDSQKGNKSILATLELRHDLSDKVQGVVFVDAGKAWNDEINNALKVSTGIGLRIKTAMGILRLDAAKSGGDSIKYMFGIGQSF